MSSLKIISQHKSFGGEQYVYSHHSNITHCEMRFAVYLPPNKNDDTLPCLFWLSGLTCTEQNFITKSGAQRFAAKYKLILIVPDTSPREIDTPKGNWKLGEGAGFYLNAIKNPWQKYFQMEAYITNELYELSLNQFSINRHRIGIFGHSMGGLGALNLAFKNPELYRSVSAFSPICDPLNSSLSIDAYTHYLGESKKDWLDYHPIDLLHRHGWNAPILIDQGSKDEFLENLKPDLLVEACKKNDVEINLRIQKGYDHSYYFIASFIEDHLRFHSDRLLRDVT